MNPPDLSSLLSALAFELVTVGRTEAPSPAALVVQPTPEGGAFITYIRSDDPAWSAVCSAIKRADA